MARIVASDVTAILKSCTIDDAVVDVFIDDAEEYLNTIFATDMTISSTLIDKIERWFVAHMIASTICRTTSEEKVGDASVKYTGKWDKNLDSTPYGQMVKQLDTTGKLANTGKMAASIYAIKSFD